MMQVEGLYVDDILPSFAGLVTKSMNDVKLCKDIMWAKIYMIIMSCVPERCIIQ